MAQVHGNPEEMRKFAASLHKFTDDLATSVKQIDQACKAAGNSWSDQESRKFMQEWQGTVQTLRRFIDQVPGYEKHVISKAQALEAYLRQGGV